MAHRIVGLLLHERLGGLQRLIELTPLQMGRQSDEP
jgi:hypothetical protein